jgi:hypothetical protein
MAEKGKSAWDKLVDAVTGPSPRSRLQELSDKAFDGTLSDYDFKTPEERAKIAQLSGHSVPSGELTTEELRALLNKKV